MRDIRFKAKRVDNGKWVEGDIIHCPNDDTVIKLCNTNVLEGYASINAKTVCQFTGFKDKNKKEIWEHDIVRADDIEDGTHFKGEIVFKYGSFIIDNKKDNESYILSEYIEPNCYPYVLTVVGNEFNEKEK